MIIEAMPQSTNMNTFEFDAAVIDVSTPKCGLASVLDENNHTHIAWVEKVNDIRSLKYSLFNGVNVTTATVYEGNLNEGIAAPSITLDDNNSPHIAFFVKRDIDGATRSGNYAVYYSGDTDGDGIFETEQVSTNPESPDDNSNGIYHCYVNGRPQITNIEGTIKIFYMSQISSLNGWDNHIISAIKSESGWQHQQEYNSDNIANVSPDNATSFAPYSDNRLYHAYIDLSDYDPYISNYNYGWNDFIINGYSGFGDNKDPHIDLVDGKYYLTWMHNSDSKKAFVVFQLESPWNKTEIPVENSPAGNLFPSTLDIVTGDFVGFYNKSWSDEAYLVTLDESANVVETPLTGIGSAFGKRVLNARNGYISLVTASESYSKIYITTNTGGSTGDELVADFNATLTTITAGESVNFTDASTGNNLSWSWSFPGGSPSSSTLQNPGVAYLTPGTYDVELTISDGTTTDVITKTDYITVNEGTTEFQADFTSTSTIIDAGGTVTFTDQSTGTPSGWQWIFEGGTPATSTESNPVVTYNVTGTYDVTLIAKTRTNADTLIKEDYIEVIENGTSTPTYNGGCWQMRDEIVNQQYFNPHKEYFIDSNGAYYFTSNGYSNDSVIKFIDPLTPAWKHALRYTINDTYFDFVLEDVSTNGHLALTNTRVDWHGKPYSSLKILDTDRNEIFAFTDIKHLTIIQSIYSKAELHLYILINETPNATEIIDLSPTVSITTSTSGYKLVKLTFDANAKPVEATELFQSSEWPGFEYGQKITESPQGGIAMKITNNNHIAFNDGSTLTMNSDENYTLVYNNNNQFEYYVKTSITLDPNMNDGFLLTDNFDVYYYITNPTEWTIDGIELNRVEHATFRKFLIKYNQSGIQWAKALNNFIEASGAE
ncbi:MAG: PKD domain-containing protein, partial [Bacteroidota bacterium]